MGLDLSGGVYAVYEVDESKLTDEQKDNLSSLISGTMASLESLLFSKGYTEAQVTESNGRIRVEIPDEEDPEKFSTATSALSGSKLSIWINNEFVIAPNVNSAISGGAASISGNYTYDQAYDLAVRIQSGSFPLVLKMSESNTLTATLGSSAIKAGLISGIVGLVLIFLYMIVMYKLMGLAASLSLWYYSLTYLFFLAVFPWVQLTLSGIAGVLLSIGMAVDANVIIFERVKEEYKSGKSLYNAMRIGFKRSLGAIIDGNMTTIIGAVVLIIFGASTIKSFGITLLIGIILSLLASLILTRIIIKCFMAFNAQARLFGLKRTVDDFSDEEENAIEQTESEKALVEPISYGKKKKGGARL